MSRTARRIQALVSAEVYDALDLEAGRQGLELGDLVRQCLAAGLRCYAQERIAEVLAGEPQRYRLRSRPAPPTTGAWRAA